MNQDPELIVVLRDNAPAVTSLVIADLTEVEHRAIIQLVRNNQEDLAEFGLVAFEMRPRSAGQYGGGDLTYAILNEPQATLLLTYMRNSTTVKTFKKRLVHDFYELRRRLSEVKPLTPLEYARKLVNAEERAESAELARQEAEDYVQVLKPPAAAWTAMCDEAGDYSTSDAAKMLSRDDKIEIGETRLFKYMRKPLGWIYHDNNGWKAYQTQIANGRLHMKMGKLYWHQGREEMVRGEPQLRICRKGLEKLHTLLGGSEDGVSFLAIADPTDEGPIALPGS